MAPFGSIYPLTFQFKDLSFPFLPYFLKDLAFRASTVGSRSTIKQMLEFAVRHGVKPMIEKFPLTLDGIGKAHKKMLSGGVRYKAVLEAPLEV